jgi:hypothetical protein
MSTRERATTIIAAIGWVIAAAITIVLGDWHKAFVLVALGALALTLGLIMRAVGRASDKTITAALAARTEAITSALAAQTEAVTSALQRSGQGVPIPVEVAHQVGFKQGWEMAQVRHPEMLDLVDVFERRFPAPPN